MAHARGEIDIDDLKLTARVKGNRLKTFGRLTGAPGSENDWVRVLPSNVTLSTSLLAGCGFPESSLRTYST